MRKVFCPLLISFALLTNAPATLAEGDPEQGKAKAATCLACHGADGNSLLPIYPNLAGLGEKYLFKQLRDIKNGKAEDGGRSVPEMQAFLTPLSDQDMQDIAAFYAGQTMQLSGAKAMDVTLNSGDSVDSLVLGEAIYRWGNTESGTPACSGCHSPTGQGNAPAGYPRLGGQSAEYVSKQLHAFRLGERVNDGDQQIMRQVAEYLSDAEIAAVANYIAGLY